MDDDSGYDNHRFSKHRGHQLRNRDDDKGNLLLWILVIGICLWFFLVFL